MTEEELTDSAPEDDAPKRRRALTKAEVWENAFTAWWIRYLRHKHHVRPEHRYMNPYYDMEYAAIDAAAWARKRALREERMSKR